MTKIFNRNITNNAHKTLKINSRQGIRVFAMTPNSGWLIITNKNKIIENNIPNECLEKLKHFQQLDEKILCVALHPSGGNRWSIITNKGFFNRNIPQECHERMLAFHDSGQPLTFVAFPSRGNNAWIAVKRGQTPNKY